MPALRYEVRGTLQIKVDARINAKVGTDTLGGNVGLEATYTSPVIEFGNGGDDMGIPEVAYGKRKEIRILLKKSGIKITLLKKVTIFHMIIWRFQRFI